MLNVVISDFKSCSTNKIPTNFLPKNELSLRAKRSGAKQSAKFQQASFFGFPQKFKVCADIRYKYSAGTWQIASRALLVRFKEVLWTMTVSFLEEDVSILFLNRLLTAHPGF